MGEERINKTRSEDRPQPDAELTPEELERISGGARGEAATKSDARSEQAEKSNASSKEQAGKKG